MLRFAAEMTMEQYAREAPRRTFVLPVGILEEHGPHLPLGTDTFQVEAVVREAAQRTEAVVLPTLWYGNAVSTRPFPGTISLRFETVRAVTKDIVDELARHGVRSLAIVSGHAGSGHMAAMKRGVQDALEGGARMKVALLSEWDFLSPLEGTTVAGVNVPPGDGHAGTMETARIQHLRPELVAKPPGHNESDGERFMVSVEGLPKGYGGDPSIATPALGKELHERCVNELVELFTRIAPR